MSNRILIAMGALFFSYATIYSVHTFFKSKLRDLFDIEIKTLNKFNRLNFIRVFTGYFFARIADKTQKPTIIAIFFLGWFVANFIAMHSITIQSSKAKLYMAWVFSLSYEVIGSGVFPCLEIFAMNVATYKNAPKKLYSQVLYSTFAGKMCAYFLIILLDLVLPEKFKLYLDLIAMTTTGILSVLFFTAFNFTKQVPRDEEVKMDRSIIKFFTEFFNIIFSYYGLVLLFVTAQGMQRNAMVDFQAMHNKNKIKIWVLSGRGILIARALFEILVVSTALPISNLIGLYALCILGAVSGAVKMLAYVYTPQFVNEKLKVAYFLFLEVFKAANSVYIGYGVTRLNKIYNSVERENTAQALYNGFYTGIPSSINGFCDRFFGPKNKEKDVIFVLNSFFRALSFISLAGLLPMILLCLLSMT